MTEKRSRRRGFLPTAEGLRSLEAKKFEKGYTYPSLAEAAGLNTEEQVENLFNPQRGRRVQRDAIEKIAKALELRPTEFIDPDEWLPNLKTRLTSVNEPSSLDWKEVCIKMWQKQKQKEDQRIRRRVTEKGLEVNVHVGLGLIQREQQQRRQGNQFDRSQIYDLTDREAIVRRFEHGEFLAEVIEQPPKANKHVAIVGEPGAGKTTLLAAIADRLSHSDSPKLPICLSLADLQKKTLQDYLLQIWLPEAFHLVYTDIAIDEAHRTAFQDWLRQGEAWILLDGVDEMGEEYPAIALNTIKTQLIGWLGNVRVALTCRSNVWDAQLNNPLSGAFDVYKTQEFKPEQIEEFIQQWFSQSKKLERGQALQQKLNEPQRERIRELVRNPLRLSLLCEVFYINPDAELPQTKAGLYEIFVRYFYEWKLEQHPTKEPQREKLNKALGKLAIGGLDSENGLHRFRLPEKAARKVMGDEQFELAEKLGWLNIVDQDADSPQAVYAFFHPTFQEYFAALAIDDWDDFLPHSHEEKPTTNRKGKCEYRIFEPQWKEAILLWLGRSHAAIEDEQKEAFMEALIDFKDGCGKEKVYQYSSYFLAVAGTSEYKFRRSLEVINQVFIWGWWCDELTTSSVPFLQSARFSIASADRKTVSAILVEILLSDEESRLQIDAAKLAGTLHIKDAEVIEALFILMNKTSDTRIRCETAFALARVSGKQEAIDTLIKLLKTKEFGRASQCLEELHIKSPKTIAVLEETINNKLYDSFSDTDVYLAARSLLNFDPGNITAKRALNFLSHNTWINTLRSLANDVLGESGSDIQAEADLAESESQSSHYEILTHQLIDLGTELDSDAMNTVNSLTNLICRSLDESVRDTATWCLETIVTSELFINELSSFSQVVTKVKACFDNFEERNDPRKIIVSFGITQKPHMGCSKLLWHCAQNMSYPEFYAAWHNPSSVIDLEAIA